MAVRPTREGGVSIGRPRATSNIARRDTAPGVAPVP